MKIGIIGLGLIGGSIARSLKKSNRDIKVIASDHDQIQLKLAYDNKDIDLYSCEINNSFSECEVVFICTPVNVTIKVVEQLSKIVSSSCIITDVSSTKLEVMEAVSKINNINFIGGHPMTGSEKSGYSGSSDILFENAFYIVTPSEKTSEASLQRLKSIIESMGAIYIELAPEEHDEYVSIISHIPHILASCLVNFVKDNDTESEILKTLCAGGFKDITRIASSSGTLWNSIIMSNKQAVLKNLQLFIDEQLKIYDIIESSDNKNLLIDYIDTGKEYRNSFESKKSAINIYEMSVDVPDEPNVIGIVATILGNNAVNIKNIGINNHRELSEYALSIVFYDESALKDAEKILTANNYKLKIK